MKFKEFLKTALKPLIVLGVCLVLIFTLAAISDGVQKDWGNIEVTSDSFIIKAVHDDDIENAYDTNVPNYEASYGAEIAYKLYKPKTATSENPAPAALLLHGYQNDHETCDAYCIELAKRGMVVLAIDEYGHGYTTAGLVDRGYVAQKVTVNYGTEEKITKPVNGVTRYKIMMNFSNLTIFDDIYTEDEVDNVLLDSSMGGISAYAWLLEKDYVKADQMVVSGHSMGTWASWTVCGAYNGCTIDGTDVSPKALVLQCGEVFDTDATYNKYLLTGNGTDIEPISNILMLQAKWDEFNYFRDYQNIVSDDLLKVGTIRHTFLNSTGGCPEDGKFDTVYGDLSNGTARSVRLLYTNHRLTTHNTDGLKTAIAWIDASLENGLPTECSTFTYRIKDYFMFAATLIAIVSMFALMNVLIKIPFFASFVQTVPMDRDYRVKKGWKWWKGACITMGIAFATYPFMTQLGHGLLPLPDFFRMTIGNGFVAWYLLLIIVMLCTTIIPYNKSKKTEHPMDFVDMGLSRFEHKDKFDWQLFGKMVLIVLSMFALMYVECILCQAFFQLDFRFIWPFFKGFTWDRFLQFLIYIPIFAVFFLLNNSKIFAQMRVDDCNKPGFKAFMKTWYKMALCMVGGILVIVLLEYIPFFADLGPGADLLFGTTFGGPFMSLLIVFVPQVLVFSVFCTYAYRKTGSIYVGALTAAVLACWIVTGGSAIM